ncbi:CYTH and CHAD domain-containing protein [Actinocrinis sp.]|uniref:CYTH and CHAD domain-containing protein n=1 Tax=Actinocrinis sp. TaxID=1920516 RepID=UPI002D40043A|nr:CYTH and CHAD domain-containing protein [Actinocrinis sp.]HZP51228.1 CYTH and CHAD domain-containing protein [Actinocrinis sp.]
MTPGGDKSTVRTEREAKLRAPADFTLPDLGDLMPGVIGKALPEQDLDAVYYDTADLRLARFGITVRHRCGEDAPCWTVKFPDPAERGPALVRSEIEIPGPRDPLPERVADLVLAYTRNRSLVPVAALRTRRRPFELRDSAGRGLGQIVDDEVTATRENFSPYEFREVEVEIGAGGRFGRELMRAAVTRLEAAGASAGSPIPKLVRVLGVRATRPPQVRLVELAERPSASELVQHAVARSVTQLLRHDPGVRLGTDPEDVHQLRVAARRLRSDLRTFAPLLEGEQIDAVRQELGWVGRQVGEVRDADVLGARLAELCATLPEADRAGAARLLQRHQVQSETAREAMLTSLRDRRYLRLIDALVKLAGNPPMRATAMDPNPDSDTPPPAAAMREELAARLVRRPWRRLKRGVAQLGPDPADERLHEVRILAKRCRYAAEAVVPVSGRRAERLASRMAKVQTVLGDHQDTAVAEDWLRAAAEADPKARLAAGQLIAAERARRAELRARWPVVWSKASSNAKHPWPEYAHAKKARTPRR